MRRCGRRGGGYDVGKQKAQYKRRAGVVYEGAFATSNDIQIAVTSGQAMVRARLAMRLAGDATGTALLGSVPPSPIEVAAFDANRQMVGGLVGSTYARVLDNNVLWVAEPYRGQGLGRKILLAAEVEAIRRGCVCSILNTYSFQAPGFYERLGYERFGEVEYAGLRRIYFRKVLVNTEERTGI